MSARNGDKARFGKQRKRKMAHRARTEELRAGLKAGVVDGAVESAEAPKSEHHGVLGSAAEGVGSALGSIAAKLKGTEKPETTHAE